MKSIKTVFFALTLALLSPTVYSLGEPTIQHESGNTYLATITSSDRDVRCSELTKPLLEAVDKWCAEKGGKRRHIGHLEIKKITCGA